ncbi:hypothetical protein M1M34_gp039 [Haloarcula tailed virus 2]|uniref:Uncharacterized protein n=1 Tax=Haloarcula tailed virus 2 TaxID=2877989 RepID=A0AAE8XYW9_9CAUD|nr:hypothetical protein M1M34_gp039 [Haloarcula tailed virus 2]UBF23190.1 hypothetical protein HATV-2_gp39 [Haloarcula tailed virus 2]
MQGITTFRVTVRYDWQTCCHANTTDDEFLLHGGSAGDIERAVTEAYRNMWLTDEDTVRVTVKEVEQTLPR